MSKEELPPRPQGHEYYGPLEPATLTDGWCYGYVTLSPCPSHPEGCDSGDGYAVAPDGTYAGLVWWTQCPWEIEPAEDDDDDDGDSGNGLCFGVFEVQFQRPVESTGDLVANFRDVLPLLKARRAQWLAPRAETGDDDHPNEH
jgi:hypothetical protein